MSPTTRSVAVQDAPLRAAGELAWGRVGLVSHTPFWMFDHGRELRRRGWRVSLYTATPRRMIDPAVAEPIHVKLGWATASQALRRLARFGLYLPGRCFWAMERRARAELAAWAAPRLGDIALLDALSSWGVELGRLVQRAGGRHVCSRGSSHILFQEEILREEFARWSCPPPDGFSDWLVERELAEYEAADAIAVPSGFVLQTFLARGVPAHKLHRTPYGVNLALFSRKPRADRRFRVLFVGSASVRKGIGYLLEAMAPLARRGRVELWLVGAVTAEALGIVARHRDVVIAKGFVPASELAEVYSQGSVLVLPSIEEGLARVQVQAMACGVPVIATPNTGAGDLITDGREGFIVPIRDSRAIRDRLEWMLAHPTEREQMGEAAMRRVAGQSGWQAYGDAVERMYRSLLGGRVGA
jgi:glycosyltransferase involved in cell wall biosynthesis